MGREKEPFHDRRHSQDARRRSNQENEYDPYLDDEFEDEYDLYSDDDFELDNTPDIYEQGSRIPRRQSATPLPPFPSTNKNSYSRTSRARRVPSARTPRPPMRSTPAPYPSRSDYPLDEPQQPTPRPRRPIDPFDDEPQQPPRRRSTESYRRPAPQTRRIDDVPRRPASMRAVSREPEPRKRRVWPIFLIGCAAGAVSLVLAVAIIVLITIQHLPIPGSSGGSGSNGSTILDKPNTQTVPLSALSQLQVCDVGGHVSVGVDPNPAATDTTVTTTKIAQTNDQNEAQQIFRQIFVSIATQPLSQSLACPKSNTTSPSNPAPTPAPVGANSTTLSVNVTYSSNLTGQTVPAVDVTILLPKFVVQVPDPTSTMVGIQVPHGNIDVKGLSGIMQLQNSSGDITVTNGVLVDGSKLEAQGNLTFDGSIWERPVPPNKQPSMFFGGESQINLTLPATTTAILAATSNKRTAKITSDFPITVDTSDNGYPAYHGPFNPTIQTNAATAPVLTLIASSGSIAIHKKVL